MSDDPMRCACRSDDPYECLRLRMPYDPDPDEKSQEQRIERCECCCHQEYFDRLQEEYEDMIQGEI